MGGGSSSWLYSFMCARGGGDSRGGEMKATEDDADDDHVSEWEKGLPTNEELMPLSQSLISPALASAFSIRHEPANTPLDVQRRARATLQNLRNQKPSIPSFGSYPSFQAPDKLRGTQSPPPLSVQKHTIQQLKAHMK